MNVLELQFLAAISMTPFNDEPWDVPEMAVQNRARDGVTRDGLKTVPYRKTAQSDPAIAVRPGIAGVPA